MDLKAHIQVYLDEAKVMQLATMKDGKPWVCTVNFAVDENWNLYWMSLRSTLHSQQLVQNGQVAGAVVKDPTVIQGIQFEGQAKEVTGSDLEKANDVFEKRYGHKPEILEEAKSGDASVRTYYLVKPTKIVLFDKVNFPDNPRQEFVL